MRPTHTIRSFIITGLCAALIVGGLSAHADTTGQGNAATGAKLFEHLGCSNCHMPVAHRYDAANAGNVIQWLSCQRHMTDCVDTEDARDLAAFIASPGNGFNPVTTVTVPYNDGHASATAIEIPYLFFPPESLFGPYASIVGVTAPTKGTVAYAIDPASGLASAHYTPNAGQTGTDSFSYQASGPAGTSSIRMVNVTIASPIK